MVARESRAGHCQAVVLRLLGDYTTLRIIDFLRLLSARGGKLLPVLREIQTFSDG